MSSGYLRSVPADSPPQAGHNKTQRMVNKRSTIKNHGFYYRSLFLISLRYLYIDCVQTNGASIRRRREEAGFGLTAFARAAQMNPSTLSRIERNLTNPRPETLHRIARQLGVPISTIGHSEEPQP